MTRAARVERHRRLIVPRATMEREVVRAMVRAPIRRLDLDRRVPEFCRRTDWPEGERKDGVLERDAFVAAALSCYYVGAVHQQLRVPPFLLRHPTWAAMAREHGHVLTAAHIVECLSPDEIPVGDHRRLDSLLAVEAKRAVGVD